MKQKQHIVNTLFEQNIYSVLNSSKFHNLHFLIGENLHFYFALDTKVPVFQIQKIVRNLAKRLKSCYY